MSGGNRPKTTHTSNKKLSKSLNHFDIFKSKVLSARRETENALMSVPVTPPFALLPESRPTG